MAITDTPIIFYNGPLGRRAELISKSRALFDTVDSFTKGLQHKDFGRILQDGTRIKVKTVSPKGPHVIQIDVPLEAVFVKPKREEEEAKRKRSYTRKRLAIGLEYTDATELDTISGWGSDYLGFGVLVGTIASGRFHKMEDLRWDDPCALKSPWKYSFTPGSPSYVFNAQMQGETKSRTSGPPDQRRKITPLEELSYSSAMQPDYFETTDYPVGSNYYEGDFWYYFDGYANHEFYHYWVVHTTWVEINGTIVLGPFEWIDDNFLEAWWEPGGAIGNWGAVNHPHQKEWKTYTGTAISDLAGVVVDEDTYLILYSLVNYDNCEEYWFRDPSASSVPHFHAVLQAHTFSGVQTQELHILASGAQHKIAGMQFNFAEDAPWSGYDCNCTRIFTTKTPADPKSLVYVYSFIEPQGLVEYEYVAPPRVQYGMTHGDSSMVTTEGYPAKGVLDDGYMDYDYNANIVPGMPDGFYGSILARALDVETYYEEEVP